MTSSNPSTSPSTTQPDSPLYDTNGSARHHARTEPFHVQDQKFGGLGQLPKRGAEYAVWGRDVVAGRLVHHSDKGTNYTSFRFSKALRDNGILASMGSTGDSYDNAMTENFWSTLKIELVYRNTWRTREEAENAIFAYIDGWYNPTRIQKELGYLSPDQYEAAYHQNNPTTRTSAIPDLAPTRAS